MRQTEAGRIDPRQQEVLETVRRLLEAVVDDDWEIAGTVGMDTAFGQDLELESIEFVLLAEKLKEQYGESVDFVGWISQKGLDEIIALKVGDLVEFIASCP